MLKSLLAAAISAAATADTPLSLTVLPQAYQQRFGAACLDGSPPAFYSLVQDTTKWVIFLEGGGWCFDITANATIANCAGRATGGGGSSNGMGGQTSIGGMLSPNATINPRFSNYSLVFVHYCDGSSMSSNASQPIPVPADVRAEVTAAARKVNPAAAEAPAQIYMRGRPNLAAVLAYLREVSGMGTSPAELIVSGGSAGAIATYLSIDWIRGLFPASTKVAAVPDAGFFFDGVNIATGATTYRDDFIAADPVWNSSMSGGLDADCVAVYGPQGQAWKCFLQQYAVPFIQTPLFVSNSLLDMWQVLNILNVPCVPSTGGQSVAGYSSCNAGQMLQVQSYWAQVLAALQGVLDTSPATGAWAVTCFVHELNVEYCSTQSLPNCMGWGTAGYMGPKGQGNYTIPWAGPQTAARGAGLSAAVAKASHVRSQDLPRWNLNDVIVAWYHNLVSSTGSGHSDMKPTGSIRGSASTTASHGAYNAVLAARTAYVHRVLDMAHSGQLRVGKDGAVKLPTWAELVASDATGQLGALAASLPPVVQALDTSPWPTNPSCPFPWPTAGQ